MSVRIAGVLAGAIALASLVSVPSAARGSSSGAIVYAAVVDGVAEYDALTGRRVSFVRQARATTVAVDAARNLYVGRLSGPLAPAFVGVYAPEAASPFRAIHLATYPIALAVSASGAVAAAVAGAGLCCPGGIAFIGPGATFPGRYAKAIEHIYNYSGVAVDASGGTWVDGSRDDGRLFVGYVAPGSDRVSVKLFSGLAGAGPMTIDSDGNVVVAGSSEIQTFTPAGALVRARTTGFPPHADIVGVAVSSDGLRLYAAIDGGSIEGFPYRLPSAPPALTFGAHVTGSIAIGG
jgi:hypothetical protein